MTYLNNKKSILPLLISLLLAAGMTAASEILHEKEIIFPEITAITIGALAAPKLPWNTTGKRLFLTIMSAALFGMGIVFLPIPQVIKVPLAMVCAIGCITLSETGFFPALSACVLPVLLGTKTPIYLLSAGTMTALILLARHILGKFGIYEPNTYTPMRPDSKLYRLRLKQIITASLICIDPLLTGEIFFIAPPLIVVFFEMSSPQSKLMKRIPQVMFLIVLGAFAGTASRFIITETLGLPLTLSAVLSCSLILFAVSRMKMYFPPCGAIATLPLIIPSGALMRFPFEIAGGAAVLTAATFIISHERRIAVKIKRALRPQN